MTRGVGTLLAACSLLAAPLAGCNAPGDADGYAALESELEGTRQVSRPTQRIGQRSGEPLPLAGAEPHTAVLKGVFSVNFDDGRRSIQVNRTVERGAKGQYHITDSRYWRDPDAAADGELEGREIIFDGDKLAVRRAWGPWMLRDTVGGHDERLLREAYDIGDAILGSFRPYLTLHADGRDRLAGLDVTWFRVELDRGVAPRKMAPEELAALRAHDVKWPAWLAATHRPFDVRGRIALRGVDDKGGELVAGELELEGAARWGALGGDFAAVMVYTVSALPPMPGFTIPTDALPATRERPWRMIEDVMRDALAEPWKRE